MKRIQFLQGPSPPRCAWPHRPPAWRRAIRPSRSASSCRSRPAAPPTCSRARSSQKMGEKLGTTLVIDNKPGAGGAIGSDLAAKAPPDGYTLLLATTSTHSIGPAITPSCPTTRCATSRRSRTWAMRPASCWCPTARPPRRCANGSTTPRRTPASSTTRRAATAPSCSSRRSSSSRRPACFVTHIPYKGTALAIPDLISGKVDVLFDSLPTGMPHVRDGRLRALGVTIAQAQPAGARPAAHRRHAAGLRVEHLVRPVRPQGTAGRHGGAHQHRRQRGAGRSRGEGQARAPGHRAASPARREQLGDSMVAADAAKWKKIIVERKITND